MRVLAAVERAMELTMKEYGPRRPLRLSVMRASNWQLQRFVFLFKVDIARA